VWPVVSAYIPKDLLSLVKHQIFIRLLCFVVPVIIVIALSVIIFSHRIAGPIYNIEQKLIRITQGEDIDSIHLRKGDELKDLAEIINNLLPAIKRGKEFNKENSSGNS
jgi:signal transduction histidine kinase